VKLRKHDATWKNWQPVVLVWDPDTQRMLAINSNDIQSHWAWLLWRERLRAHFPGTLNAILFNLIEALHRETVCTIHYPILAFYAESDSVKNAFQWKSSLYQSLPFVFRHLGRCFSDFPALHKMKTHRYVVKQLWVAIVFNLQLGLCHCDPITPTIGHWHFKWAQQQQYNTYFGIQFHVKLKNVRFKLVQVFPCTQWSQSIIFLPVASSRLTRLKKKNCVSRATGY